MSSSDISGSNYGLAARSSTGNIAERTAVACLTAIAWYNALELIVLCFTTFKRYGGCYFWCLLISSISIIPFGLGYLLIIFDVYDSYFSVAMELIAWICMVTGQSLVLWSRLHLVVHSPTVLRWTLAMIIVDAIIFHIPASVLELGSHSNKADLFTPGFNIFERIQLIAFSVQEAILSMIYSWEAVRLLNLRPRGNYRGTLVQLLVVNLAMICMDAAIIGVQYSGLFDVHVTLKAFAYSVKLKLEYAILGKLVDATTQKFGSSGVSAPTDLSDFVDLSHNPNNQPPADSDSQARIWDDPENIALQQTRGSSKLSSDPRVSETATPDSNRSVLRS
ncbi:hypothetical protein N7509_010906 [Penicillium cosmopolitanum]|uniref:DUF7703 domain-containing protein n=1 Tax=Penicillium cosmopolitanum TaxID=1131564 RepID=A0A9W9VSE7_9EURO|nr:uncharacterized protein N7509_010906 [Penicillium cosmopolitanum]KAJ5388365.1 hypothetical protein N7509_010906 [Penicillium cosmopolitanum]